MRRHRHPGGGDEGRSALHHRGRHPGKAIRKRFDDAVIERLEALRWWDWEEEKIRRAIPAIRSGDLAALGALL